MGFAIVRPDGTVRAWSAHEPGDALFPGEACVAVETPPTPGQRWDFAIGAIRQATKQELDAVAAVHAAGLIDAIQADKVLVSLAEFLRTQINALRALHGLAPYTRQQVLDAWKQVYLAL